MMANAVVTSLTALSLAGSWTSESPSVCPLSEREGRLEIGVRGCAGDGVVRVMLKEPVPVPAGCDLFFKAMRPKHQSVTFRALVRDEKDREFAVWTGGAYSLAKSNLFGGQFRPGIVLMSGGEWRVHARLSNLTGENCEPVGSARLPAAGRLRLVGVDLRVESEKPDRQQCVWLRDFAFSDVSYANAKFYYSFMGQERFGELDGDPVFSGLDVQAATWGPKHVLEWELRDAYDAKPFLQGTRTIDVPDWQSPDRKPLGFLVPQETFRVREEGSYWLHLKWSTRWKDLGKPTEGPGAVWNWTVRYDVFRGEKAKARRPVADAALNSAARERLAKQAKVRAEAVCRRNNYVRPPLPTSEEVRTGGHSLVELCAPRDAESSLKLLEEMAKHGFRHELEIQTSWADMEPLEGAYDFRAVDAVLDAAAEKGVGCLVTFAPLMPPEWMRSSFTENEDGYRMGHCIYLFNGGRINVFNDPYVRGKALAFCEALIRHVRSHPALLGYFYIVEHGGDMPSRGWFEGYDVHTRANFRTWLAARYGTVERLNAGWGTAFRSFAEVEPPHQLRPRAEDTPLRVRDWTDFKLARIEGLQFEVATLARSLDPTRVIMVYGSPTFGQGVFDYSKIGVLTANGGCHSLNHGYAYAALGEAGLYQRMEESSCTSWTRCWPTQLDTSLFAMMHGGGLMTHMKMFWKSGAKMDDPQVRDRDGFGRFRRFVPIEAELRGAERVWDPVAGWTSSRGCHGYGEWNWAMVENSQLQARTSVTPAWREAKIVFASPAERQLRRREIEDLKSYVENGGTLFMTCRTGGIVLDDRRATNALLKAFGISAPVRDCGTMRVWATATEESAWWPRARGDEAAFRTMLTNPMQAPDDAGETLLVFRNLDAWRKRNAPHGLPALTRKRFGKGSVCVLWADYVPYSWIERPELRAPCLSSRSFMTELAADAGVKPAVTSDRREVYSILLKKGAAHYLLVTSNQDMVAPAHLTLEVPEGCAQAVDLISGQTHPLPLSVRLKKHEVLVLKLQGSAGKGQT